MCVGRGGPDNVLYENGEPLVSQGTAQKLLEPGKGAGISRAVLGPQGRGSP